MPGIIGDTTQPGGVALEVPAWAGLGLITRLYAASGAKGREAVTNVKPRQVAVQWRGRVAECRLLVARRQHAGTLPRGSREGLERRNRDAWRCNMKDP